MPSPGIMARQKRPPKERLHCVRKAVHSGCGTSFYSYFHCSHVQRGTEPDKCSSMPCQNGGTCIQEMTGFYKCQCHEGFRGTNCEGMLSTTCRPLTDHYRTQVDCLPTTTDRTSTAYRSLPTARRLLADHYRPLVDCLPTPIDRKSTAYRSLPIVRRLLTDHYRTQVDCLPTTTHCRAHVDRLPISTTPATHTARSCTCTISGQAASVWRHLPNSKRRCIVYHKFLFRLPEEMKCHANPCLNGGTCFENSGGFTCSCPDGYRGLNCAGEAPQIFDCHRRCGDFFLTCSHLEF